MPAPQNPYAERRDQEGGSVCVARGDALGPKGLSTRRLDDLVRSAEHEAYQDGYQAAEDEMTRRMASVRASDFPRIYDEGYDAGLIAGHAAGVDSVVSPVLARAVSIKAALDRVATGRLAKEGQGAVAHALSLSEQIIDRCREVSGVSRGD